MGDGIAMKVTTRVLLSVFVIGITSLNCMAMNDIEKLCSKTGLPVVELKYRDRIGNIHRVRGTNLGKSNIAKFLTQYYSQPKISKDEGEQVKLSSTKNLEFQPKSEAMMIAMNWAGRDVRVNNPKKYIAQLLKFIDLTIPSLAIEIRNYFKFKDSDLLRSEIIPAPANKADFYGARGGVYEEYDSKSIRSVRMVKVSNNPSENFPYLSALVGHEIIHAIDSYSDRKKLYKYNNNNQWAEWSLMNETKAYDYQFKYYVEAVKKNPDLFCNWLYPTWSNGEIIVPLSWTMSAMLKEAEQGKLIYNQLKLPLYAPYANYFLKGKGHNRFKGMLKEVKDRKYKYVK